MKILVVVVLLIGVALFACLSRAKQVDEEVDKFLQEHGLDKGGHF